MLNSWSAATWVTRIEPAAIARRPSKSGKRGLPGGGATASGAAWLLTVRAAYAGRRRRLARVAPAVGFRGRLAIVALAALAIRTAATIYHRDYPVIGDALTFHLEGGHLAHGEGFRRVFEDVPTAEHPPLFICLIALFTLLGADGFLAQKLLLGLVGTVTVVLVGLLARRVAGDRAGLVAAALAAVYPLLWLADGSLMSESLYGPLIVAVLLAAYAYFDARTVRRVAVLGALIALAALTRGEALLLLPLLGLALVARGTLIAARAARAPRRARGSLRARARPVVDPQRDDVLLARAHLHQRRRRLGRRQLPPDLLRADHRPVGLPLLREDPAGRRGAAVARVPPSRHAVPARPRRARAAGPRRARRAPVRRLPARADARLRGQRGPAGALGAPRRVDVLADGAASPSPGRGCCTAAASRSPSCSCRWPWSRSPRC